MTGRPPAPPCDIPINERSTECNSLHCCWYVADRGATSGSFIRCTTRPMTKKDDFEKREAATRTFVRDLAERAIALRSKDRDFHGLEREFLYHQVQMLQKYRQARDINHPRDRGNARERILSIFLQTSGYLPKRYAVSDRSVRVVSTTGHI